uniref:KAP family P-loop domain-containing protein n=1 Tax=Candidatus Kentrum sp. LPFa TaxID=2126335 RepID=A0A450W6A2_9GAMM|nr:MAG: KAP family P-loop domain-containing protein [Candidatus Kentron sp. LPFa]
MATTSDNAKKPRTPLYRNDLWTLEDDFSLGRAGDQVARMALEVEPPFTLGVTGKWGAGKTSIMRRAFATLGGQPIRQERALAEPGEEGRSEEWENLACANDQRKSQLGWPEEYFDAAGGVFCVWFSPWQHQNEENPLIPLLREIRIQFQAQIQTSLRNQSDDWQKLAEKTDRQKKHKENVKKIWTQCRSNGLASINLLARVGDAALSLAVGRSTPILSGTIDAIHQIRQEGKDKDAELTALSDGQRFHLLFEDAVDQLLKTHLGFKEKGNAPEDNAPRLILFIDDLDRCEEAVIVRLLESIKLYLASRRCVFVLGLDDSAVLDTLTRYWQGRSQDSNREYLEKLFQAILAVPLPATARVREAVAEQLRAHGIPSPERLAEDIEQLLEPNPRKIKNFVNGLCATWEIHDIQAELPKEAGSKVRYSGARPLEEEQKREREKIVRRFLIFHYLRLYHRPVWRLLERQPESLAILRSVIWGPSEADPSPKGIDPNQQRLLKEFYFRAFSHVLNHPKGESGEERLFHGNESLDKAVEHFQARQDRKRSDECLCGLFRELIPRDYQLNKRYLYLDANGAPQPTPSDNP